MPLGEAMHLSKELQSNIDLISSQSDEAGFDMSCDPAVAELCALLAAPIANKRLLEIGTGTGLSTLYIAQLMPESAELTFRSFVFCFLMRERSGGD